MESIKKIKQMLKKFFCIFVVCFYLKDSIAVGYSSFVGNPLKQREAIGAAIDEILWKFSRNQRQFEEAISGLNFTLSDDAVARLQRDLDQIREAVKVKKQIEVTQEHLDSFEPGPDSIDFDFSSLHFTELRESSEELRTDRDGFTFPSIKEWFSDRRRDWGLLGAEIMGAYDDVFAQTKPSSEAFIQLIHQSIERITSRGQFVWFEIAYPEFRWGFKFHSYSIMMKSFRDGTINREEYNSLLANQVFHVLLNVPFLYRSNIFDGLDYDNFAVKVVSDDPKPFQDDYFPVLNENHLKTLFDIDTRRQAVNRAMAGDFENLKVKDTESALENPPQQSMSSETFSFHPPKVSKERYEALREVFMDCYAKRDDSVELEPSSINEEINDKPFFVAKAARFIKSGSYNLPAFVSQSYSFSHQDLYCRVIAPIFRQIYIENELEIYRRYLSKGEFYRRGMELREELRTQSEELREAEAHLAKLQADYQKERDKDQSWTYYIGLLSLRTSQNKLRSIQSERDKASENVSLARRRKADLKGDWELYIGHNHFLHKVHLADSVQEQEKSLSNQLKEAEARLAEWREWADSDWYWLWYSTEEIKSGIAKAERDIVRIQDQREALLGIQDEETEQISVRLELAKRYVRKFEGLLAYFQEDYEGAESDLISLSLDNDFETIETEWLQAARGFFNGLQIMYQESLQKAKEEIVSLQSRLAGLEERNVQASPLRERYIELKIQVISDLINNRPPRLEDIFYGFLLLHYEPFGRDFDSFHAFCSDLNELANVGDSLPIDSFKPAYEEALAKTFHEGQPLLYNRNAFRLAHPILENRVQCYSGSLLFFVLTELAGFTDQRFAIFTNAHIRPGVLSRNGDEFYGIETTVEGRGIVTTDPISEISGDIQIVELYSFLLIELLKHEISNFPDLYAESQNALRRYGFSIEKLRSFDPLRSDRLKDDPGVLQVEHSHPDILNITPFGFGSSNIPSFDMERVEIDEVDSLMLENFNRSWREKTRMIGIIIKNKVSELVAGRLIWEEKKIYRYVAVQTLEAFNELWPEALHGGVSRGAYYLQASKSSSSIEGEETTEEIPPLYNFSEKNFCKELHLILTAEQHKNQSPWRIFKFFEGSRTESNSLAKLEVLKKIIIEAGIDRDLDLNREDQSAFLRQFIYLSCPSHSRAFQQPL